MHKVYKITNKNGMTRVGKTGETQWGAGVTVSIPAEKRRNKECSGGVIHFYENMNLGLLMNPIHGKYVSPVMWEATTPEIVGTDRLKSWGYELTTVRQLDLPDWYEDEGVRRRVQRRFGLLCAQAANPGNPPYMQAVTTAVEAILDALREGREPTPDQLAALAAAGCAAEEVVALKAEEEAEEAEAAAAAVSWAAAGAVWAAVDAAWAAADPTIDFTSLAEQAVELEVK